MDCFQARLLLTFVRPGSGDFDRQELDALEGHLHDCGDCRALAQKERLADEALGLAMRQTPAAPSGLDLRILQRLHETRRPIPWTWIAATAAVVLIGVGLGLAWQYRPLTPIDVGALEEKSDPQSASAWFKKRGFAVEAPAEFDPRYLDSWEIVSLQGHRVPKFLYVNHAKEAMAHVYLISGREFTGLEEYMQSQASPGDRVEVRHPPGQPNVSYLIIYSPAGSRDAFLRGGGT